MQHLYLSIPIALLHSFERIYSIVWITVYLINPFLGYFQYSIITNYPAMKIHVHPSLCRWLEYYFCSVTQSCPTVCNPMDCSTPVFPGLHCLPEFAQTYVHWVSDAIQPSYPLSPLSPLALNSSQYQGLFQWVGFLHQVAQLLELQLQHQSFRWMFRVDFL